jgi:hypothetical protein
MADAPRSDNLNTLLLGENEVPVGKTINRDTADIHQPWCIFGVSSELQYTLVLSLAADTHGKLQALFPRASEHCVMPVRLHSPKAVWSFGTIHTSLVA